MSTFDVINPLLEEWPKDFGVPPFQQIHYSHYKPAIFAAFELHKNDIKSIVENPNPPDFQNVVAGFDDVTIEVCGDGLLFQMAKAMSKST